MAPLFTKQENGGWLSLDTRVWLAVITCTYLFDLTSHSLAQAAITPDNPGGGSVQFTANSTQNVKAISKTRLDRSLALPRRLLFDRLTAGCGFRFFLGRLIRRR
jgi:hypothetical protein